MRITSHNSIKATSLHLPGSGVNPVKKPKKKKGEEDVESDVEASEREVNPGLDMGRLFKFARNELFPCPAGGFKTDNQRHAFAVLTDFGTAPLKKALEKSFYTVSALTPAQHLHTSHCAATALHRHNTFDPRLKQVPLRDAKGTDCFTIADWDTKALTYSQLESLPCLLVLCEKGRMGDTFPFSFACLDLRVRSADSLSTMIQELGRLCRYPIAHSSPADEQLLSDPAKRKALFDQGKAVAVTWTQRTQPDGEKDLTDAGIGYASTSRLV